MEIFAQFQHWNGFLNDSSGLHWTNHVTLSPDCDNSEFTQRDGRKRRTAKCVCVANVTGLLLVCVVVIFTKYQCFSVFYKKIRLKEDEVWGIFFFKQNYCHACQTRFTVFLALPPYCVSSHAKMAATVSCYSTSLWAITEKEGNSVDWESVKAKWEELNKTFIETYPKNFQVKLPRGVLKQQEQQHFWLRDRPLEKLWAGQGIFEPEEFFFRYQIPCMNIYFCRP